jgi:hypothetical protein
MAPTENRRTFISVEEEDDRAMKKAASSAALDFSRRIEGSAGTTSQVSASRTR